MATIDDVGAEEETFQAEVRAGYRAVSIEDEPSRAAEYSFLRPGPTFGLDLRGWKEMRGFSLMADYLNEADYTAEADLNHKGLVRINLATERLFHNLDHLPFADRPDAFKPGGRWVDFTDANPGDRYAVEVEQNRASLRAKLPNYPAHVNIEYWRLERTGRKQLRFLDHGADDPAQDRGCNQCHVSSRTRPLDRVTEEVKGSIDAHLGPIDVILEQLYREFRNREPVPVDSFGSTRRAAAGNFEHDEDPDSRLVASTLKLHTSLAGGVVAAASYTVGKRENQSELTDVREVKSETDFHKAAGDLTWIPSPRWTFNFRYRLLDMDNSNSSTLTSASEAEEVRVRNNVDLTRASYGATATLRPSRTWTVKGDYERREIHRGNTGAATALAFDPVWELPEDETVNRYRLTLLGRPLTGRKLKLNAWYELMTSDDPAYAASSEESHTVFGGATYTPTAKWGALANLRLRQDENDSHRLTQFDGDSPVIFDLDRQHEELNFSAGAWLTPVPSVTLGFNYGLLRTRIVQDLLFGTSPSLTLPERDFTLEDEKVEYSQRVQTISANATWQITSNLQGRLEGHHIRSFAAFSPNFVRQLDYFSPNTAPGSVLSSVDSEGLRDISKLDIRQNGLRLALVCQMDEDWKLSLGYTFDDYEDREEGLFDGTAQTYMASLARNW